MRTFRDSNETVWTVFEVRRQSPQSGERTSFLPGGFNDGWLCFESSGLKRRLIKYPARWREFSDAELEVLLEQAQPAPKGSLKLWDIGDGSSSSDARPE